MDEPTNWAMATVFNDWGKEISNVRLHHRYMHDVEEERRWPRIPQGQQEASFKVRYWTGTFSTGYDYWQVWFEVDGQRWTCKDSFYCYLTGDDQGGTVVCRVYRDGADGKMEVKPPKSGSATVSLSAEKIAAPTPQKSFCDVTVTHRKIDESQCASLVKNFDTYGVSVSPNSKISACAFVSLIKKSKRIPGWMKDLFWIDKTMTRIIVPPTKQMKAPAGGVDLWLRTLLMAFEPEPVQVPKEYKNTPYIINWHVTTGVSSTNAAEMEPSKKIRGDYEGDDSPRGGGNQLKRKGIVAGLTLDPRMGYTTEMGLYCMLDNQAGGKAGPVKERKAPFYRRPAFLKEHRNGEGLIIVADRFCSPDGRQEVQRTDEDAILESLFHELAAHAGRISQGLSSDHGPLDYRTSSMESLGEGVDQIAKSVMLFFGEPDESSLLHALSSCSKP